MQECLHINYKLILKIYFQISSSFYYDFSPIAEELFAQSCILKNIAFSRENSL